MGAEISSIHLTAVLQFTQQWVTDEFTNLNVTDKFTQLRVSYRFTRLRVSYKFTWLRLSYKFTQLWVSYRFTQLRVSYRFTQLRAVITRKQAGKTTWTWVGKIFPTWADEITPSIVVNCSRDIHHKLPVLGSKQAHRRVTVDCCKFTCNLHTSYSYPLRKQNIHVTSHTKCVTSQRDSGQASLMQGDRPMQSPV